MLTLNNKVNNSMKEYYSVQEVADLLGISRIAVNKKITSGQIKAKRLGRSFMIPESEVKILVGKEISAKEKKMIEQAVRKTVREYGQTLEMLGAE